MIRTNMHFLACVASAALALGAPQARAEIVGTAGAVNPASVSIAPAGPSRVIEIGARVVHRERIRTSDKGSVQVVFIDKTSLNIGPNSDLIIDEFVYDPKAGTGRMAATLAKGALRFVGGGTSHTGGATLATPAATLGVRGGVASVTHAVGGGTVAINHFGTTTVATASGTQVIRRPDFAVMVSPDGQASAPVRIKPADLASLTRQLTSATGQSGGAPRQPTDTQAVRLGLGTSTAALNPPTTPSVQSQTTASSTAQTNPAVQSSQQTQVSWIVQQGAQVQATQVLTQNPPPLVEPGPQPDPPPPPPPPVDPVPPARFYALAMSIDPTLGSGAPYLPAGFAAAGTFRNSPVLGYGLGGQNTDGTPNRFSRFMQAGLNITGQGAAQVSTIYVMTGSANSSSFDVFDGGFTATTRRQASVSAGRANGNAVALGSNVTFDANYSPIAAQVTQNGYSSTGVPVPQTAFYFPGGGVPGTEYTYSQTATGLPTPSGLGTNHPEVVLSGYGAGLMRTFSRNSNASIGPSFQFLGGLGIQLRSDDRFSAQLVGASLGPTGTPGEVDTAHLQFGYQGPGTIGSRGVYIDYDNFAGRESRTSALVPLSTVNDQAVSGHRSLFVTAKTVNPGPSFPGVNFCQCEYTRWGFWSSETNRDVSGDVLQDILHLGTWVAGRPTDPIQMPVTGSATYTGHVIASIKASGNEYVAAGNMGTAVNFDTRIGSVNISNLDGRNYAGDIAISSNAFGGTLNGTGLGGPTMDVIGQFYDGPLGPAREIGGSVLINGGGAYQGAGTFAGARTSLP